MIEVTQIDKNTFKFSLKTSDGNILLHSVPYNSREQLNAVVSRLHALASNQMAFERKTNHQGKFLFQLRGTDGLIIGISQLYNSEAGMENGIKNLKNRIAALRGTDQS
jgi:uncharacterized protein YegP (UPF0339 family)